jgi:WD40 repeat protein
MEINRVADFTVATTVSTTEYIPATWADETKILASVTSIGGIRVWGAGSFDVQTELLTPGSVPASLTAHWQGATEFLAAGGGDGKLYIWNAASYALQTTVQMTSAITTLVSEDGGDRIFLGLEDGHLHSYDLGTGQAVDHGSSVGAPGSITGMTWATWSQPIWLATDTGGVQGRTESAGLMKTTHFWSDTDIPISALTADTYYLYAPARTGDLYILEKP